MFKRELFDNRDLSEDDISKIVNLTQTTFLTIERELHLTDFWDNIPAQSRLKGDLIKILLSREFKDLPNIITNRNAIVSRMVEIAKNNTDIILYSE